jgi:NADH:ubiquinone oxidoreductase subunit E
MPYLKEVSIHGYRYFYLFHTIRKNGKFHKVSKYLGKEKPSDEALAQLKKSFIEEIKQNPLSKHADEKNIVNVVAILQELQAKRGYLEKSDIIQISKQLQIPAVLMYGVATFYSQFKLHKPGKYVISMCRGTACHVKNSLALLNYIEDLIDIKPGQTTPDGKISLETVNCIGACAKAPAMMINNIVYGELTQEKVKKIIADLK